jgi:hypothetical protein
MMAFESVLCQAAAAVAALATDTYSLRHYSRIEEEETPSWARGPACLRLPPVNGENADAITRHMFGRFKFKSP